MTRFRCRGIFSDRFIENIMDIVIVKEWYKKWTGPLVKGWAQNETLEHRERFTYRSRGHVGCEKNYTVYSSRVVS